MLCESKDRIVSGVGEGWSEDVGVGRAHYRSPDTVNRPSASESPKTC